MERAAGLVERFAGFERLYGLIVKPELEFAFEYMAEYRPRMPVRLTGEWTISCRGSVADS